MATFPYSGNAWLQVTGGLLMRSVLLLAVLAPLSLSAAYAETPPAAPPAAAGPAVTDPAPAPVACCRAPAGMRVDIQVVDLITTKVVKKGDKFQIRLVAPIIVDGKIIVPAGVMGQGEVIDAAHGGLMGKPGELLLAARYLDYNGQRIPLRAFKLSGRGDDNSDLALVVSMAGVPGAVVSIFIKGGEVVIPSGTRASAKLAADLTLPPAPLPVAAPAGPTPTSPAPTPAPAPVVGIAGAATPPQP